MLHALPFTTFGEVARLGLEVHVSCSRCHDPRRIALDDNRLLTRPFAGTRFICAKAGWNGETCGGLGCVYIRPAEMLQVGGPITLAFLFCRRCVPYWQIGQVQLDRPPWSATQLGPDDRFRCPACRGRVDWHIHGPACQTSDCHAVVSQEGRQAGPWIFQSTWPP
jgi:hypothetical protein